MPGVLPTDEEEDREPDTEVATPEDSPAPTPGGALGAAVAAALQAALERTGEAPPSPLPPVPPTPTTPPTEPLDLLDTSSAPWLADPELGVQWAESWIASEPQVDPPAEPDEAVVEVVSQEPPRVPEAATPPVLQEPEVIAPPPSPPRPAPAPPSAAAPDAGLDLPPTTRSYQPRSLEVFTGYTSPAQEPATWAGRSVGLPEATPIRAPVEASRARPSSRIHWMMAVMIGLAIGLLAGLVAYALGPAVSDVYLTRYDVPVARLPAALEGLRVVQVSDLHLPRSAATADSAAQLVARARPDVVLITGDMIDDASPATLAALERFLGVARGTRGTFAILGESEAGSGERLASLYEANDIRLLRNERTSVDIGNARLVVAGYDGSPKQRLLLTPADTRDMSEALRPRALIVMTHAPQLLRDVPHADLQGAAFVVAGHTLGGTLGLPSPFGGASRYRSGWYSLEATHLYVSNGIGTGRLPARLMAPAEVTRFTLRRAKQPYETPTPELPED